MFQQQLAYLAFLTLPLLLILCFERRFLKTYVRLGIFTVILASVWEPIGVHSGLWHYVVQPQFFGASVLTLLAYFHWMSFSYFAGNVVMRRLRS